MCVQTSHSTLPIKIEVVVVKIYKYFYICIKELSYKIFFVTKLVLNLERYFSLAVCVLSLLSIIKVLSLWRTTSPHEWPMMVLCYFVNESFKYWLHFIHKKAFLFIKITFIINRDNIFDKFYPTKWSRKIILNWDKQEVRVKLWGSNIYNISILKSRIEGALGWLIW